MKRLCSVYRAVCACALPCIVLSPHLGIQSLVHHVTTGTQDLGLTSQSVPGHWTYYIGQREEHPLLARD